MRNVDVLKNQKKCLSNTINELKKYIQERERSYAKGFTVNDLLRFQNKCLFELNSVFGKNSDYSQKILNLLPLPANEENVVEKHCIKNVFGSMLGIMEGALSSLQMINNRKKYQVFISSTYLDLKDYRTAAYDIITSEGYFPAGMENFIATSNDPETYIKNVIDESDYYILLIGQRYGSLVNNSSISFTEMEYEYAKKKGLTILPMIYNGKKSLCKLIDSATALNNFIKKVEKENIVKYFDNELALKLLINQALNEAVRNHPMSGWVKIA